MPRFKFFLIPFFPFDCISVVNCLHNWYMKQADVDLTHVIIKSVFLCV